MKRLLCVYDPENPRREEALAVACARIRQHGQRAHILLADPVKTREQEAHYHAQLDDIAKQVQGHGRMRTREWWKRILIDACRHETRNDPDLRDLWDDFGDYELAPALNNDGLVVIGEQSRNFGVRLASAFIDWLYAFGAEHDVRWSEPKSKPAAKRAA